MQPQKLHDWESVQACLWSITADESPILPRICLSIFPAELPSLDAMLFIPRDTFWRDNARYPQKIIVQPLDRPKNFSTTTKNSRSAKNFSTGKKFSTDKKNSRPVKKFSSGKKFSTDKNISRPFKKFSTGRKLPGKKSRKEISRRNLARLIWILKWWICISLDGMTSGLAILKIISTTFVHYGFPYRRD